MIALIALIYDWLIVSRISLYKFKRLLTKIVKKTIDDLVFTEMIHDKMQQLEKEEPAKQDHTDGNLWSRFKKCSEVLDHEEPWITYAEEA